MNIIWLNYGPDHNCIEGSKKNQYITFTEHIGCGICHGVFEMNNSLLVYIRIKDFLSYPVGRPK